MQPKSALLQLSSISKSFGAVRALKNVSFDLHAGEVHALLGENGAGKSTLIKIIAGAHPPDGGTLHLDGQLLPHLSPARAHQLGIACIYQQPALFPDLSVAENIALRLESTSAFHFVNWRARHSLAANLLTRIGADIDPDSEVRSLSMPGQQLVEIACAIGSEARLVIMDEPTASLTHKEVELLFAIVRKLRDSGVGIIYISHRLEEVFALADRVTVLRDGQSVGLFRIRSLQNNAPTQPEIDSPPQPETQNPKHACAAEADSARRPDTHHISESELIQLMVGREVPPLAPPANQPGHIVLSLKNVGCTTSGVKNVTLDVRAGEIVGLAGLVGAGRSELARVLFGITPADSGEIRLDDTAIVVRGPRDAVAQGISYVPEDRRRHGIVLDMAIAANVTLAIHPRIFPGTWLRLDAERDMANAFIRDLGIKTPGPQAAGHALSGGNQQKVSLARWLATNPKVLILDEPTQGVDVGAKAGIHDIIRRLAQDGLAVLLISSDLPEVLTLSHRIAVMRAGTITATLPGGSDAHQVMAAALGMTNDQ